MFLALRESDNDLGPAHPVLDPADPGINTTLLAAAVQERQRDIPLLFVQS